MRKYFRAQPKFINADVWVALAGGKPAGSPLMHLDSGGQKILRLYVYLNDVDESNGAFHFVQRTPSRKFVRRTKYLGNAVTDKDFINIGSQFDISWIDVRPINGAAGYGFLIDTAQCLHFGSRMESGQRQVLIMTWMMEPFAKEGRRNREFLSEAVFERGEDLKDYPSLLD
jgi:hypothetical protein